MDVTGTPPSPSPAPPRPVIGGRHGGGPLRSRQFRLLFLARSISAFGSFIAPIALAFAVLDLTGSPTALGAVLAARTVPQVLLLLAGGIWSDRLPRHLVMVTSSLIMGLVQGLSAVLLLLHRADISRLVALQIVFGGAWAFFFPASQGLVPQVVERSHLQRANALLRMTLNAATVGGGVAGGILVAAIGAGWGLVIDAGTFFVAAGLLAAMSVPRTGGLGAPNFLAELREGWREFSSRTWLWSIVVGFGFFNAVQYGAMSVLAPQVARSQLGGAAAFGLIVGAEGVGLVIGGIGGLRFTATRPLLVGCAAVSLAAPVLLLLAIPAPLALIVLASGVMGIGIETFSIYWDTALQQHIPQEALSRVYSYDMLGSIVIIPLGQVAAGPVAGALGLRGALVTAAGIVLLAVLGMLAVPAVRRLESS